MMRKRFAVFGVLALVLALLMPSRAFAWDLLPDGQMWAGEVGSNHCATVHAGEIYDAATYAVGSDPNKISASVRVKLSDPNYGGRFYEYAQTFHKMESWDDYPEWLPAYVGVAQLISNGLIGDFNIYNSEASSTLYNGAVLDFQRVLAGEDLGGGGSSGGSVVGDYHLFSVSAFANNLYNADSLHRYWDLRNASFSDGQFVVGSGVTRVSPYSASRYYFPHGRLYVTLSTLQFADEYINQGYDVIFFFDLGSSLQGFVYGRNLAIDRILTPDGTNHNVNVIVGDDRHFCASSSSFYFSDVPFSVLDISDVPTFESVTGIFSVTYYSDVFDTPFNVVPPPDGVWPEPITPVTPDPPEVPTPTAPTVTPDPEPTQPTPTWPDITINIPGAPTVEVTPTGLDYTELLTRINDNLNSINSYTVSINSGLNSLRSDLVTEFESVEQAVRNIYQFLQHMDSMLERHCQHLRDALSDCTHHLELYMKELFEWLPQQLNYDAQFEYDDSAVTSLLQRILNKIPGGSTSAPTTYKPNPQADEPGFFDWLTDLWHRFLIDLVSVLPDEIGGLVDAFSQLTHYFPFSIPWDLAAMLALFEHEPVTPVFDVPWGFGGNEGDVEMVRVDLSPWDGVMQMVRPVFVVGFCWQLALITKDLLAGFDLNKGGV